ncbi:MAG: SMP-30/gluconolactonase/LRE family protein [Rhodoferax sp.]|nr:SMP-30/gluconolactonase/LRE family protein [Rhodoferax sp.]
MRKIWKMLIFVAAVGSLVGCVGVKPQKTQERQKTNQILWPALPDRPRFRFSGTLRSAADIVQEDKEQALRRQFTGQTEVSYRPVLNKPTGIAVRFGLVYVAEPAAKAIIVFDMQRRKLFRFGVREPNALQRPQSIAVDREGLVYVLDSQLRKVMVFDRIGLFIRSINVKDGFTNPVAVAVNPNGKTIYVVDRGDIENNDHKVVAFSADGRELFRLGARGNIEGKFNIPLAAAVAEDGTLYVADSGNFRVQAFDETGKFKFQFGRIGIDSGSFSRPKGVAVDPAGNIYVSDAGFNNVQIFNSEGQLLMPIGGLSLDPGPGRYGLIASIAVDESGRLFVNDHYFNKIEVFFPISDDEWMRMGGQVE